jgi:hypothetical protein
MAIEHRCVFEIQHVYPTKTAVIVSEEMLSESIRTSNSLKTIYVVVDDDPSLHDRRSSIVPLFITNPATFVAKDGTIMTKGAQPKLQVTDTPPPFLTMAHSAESWRAFMPQLIDLTQYTHLNVWEDGWTGQIVKNTETISVGDMWQCTLGGGNWKDAPMERLRQKVRAAGYEGSEATKIHIHQTAMALRHTEPPTVELHREVTPDAVPAVPVREDSASEPPSSQIIERGTPSWMEDT